MRKCGKCRELGSDGFWHVDVTKNKYLCKYCHQFLADHPNLTIECFMKRSTKVMESIRKAHKDRMKGESPWQSNLGYHRQQGAM